MNSYFKHLPTLLCTLFVLLTFGSIAAALDAMPPGSLKAFAISSDNPRYIERWVSSNPENQQQIQTALRFAPGETAYTAVIVTGYSRDLAGQVDLDAGFRFYDRDGKVLFRRDTYAGAKHRMTRETGFIMLDPALDISFDPQDAPGNYRLEFEVNDNISRRRTVASLVLTLDPQKYTDVLKQPIDDARILDDLWRYYDQSQDPRALRRLISVLHWARDKTGEKKTLGIAAGWSLANRTNHSARTRSQCQQFLNDPEVENRDILEQILETTPLPLKAG